MKKVDFFESEKCCYTGEVSQSFIDDLMRITAVTIELQKNGFTVERHELLNQEKGVFENELINNLVLQEGEEVLPITLVDGVVVKTKDYPTNEELEEWLEVKLDSVPSAGFSGILKCGSLGCCS